MKTKPILLFLALLCGAVYSFAQAATTTSSAATVPFTIVQGSAFNISVTVGAGTTPYTYQWTKDGIAIPAPLCTASNLSFTSALSSDAGIYVVTVSNSAGSTVSNSGNVSVSIPLPIVIAPNTASLVIGPGANQPPGAAK